jgi:quinol monooxygenase YgiN|tara:strand:- start:222 stop:515 length:294 start_codon:yes stop_codon:yes gene_type:complete
MSVMVILEMPVKPDMLEDYLNILKGALVETRNYKGCRSVTTLVDQETSSVVLVEEWDSVDDQQAYMAWRMETGLIDAIGPFMQGELVTRTFDLKTEV